MEHVEAALQHIKSLNHRPRITTCTAGVQEMKNDKWNWIYDFQNTWISHVALQHIVELIFLQYPECLAHKITSEYFVQST